MPGFLSQEIQFQRGDAADPEVFTPVGAVSGISGIGGGSPQMHDVTTLADTVKQELAGLPDEGTMSLTLQWDGSDAEFQGMFADRKNRTIRNFKIVFPAPDGTEFDITGQVLTFEIAAESDSAVTVSVSIRVNALEPTWPA